MRFNSSILIKTGLTVLSVIVYIAAFAQPATGATEVTVRSEYNQLAIVLAIMTIVLAFVIWGMGQVLIALGRQVIDKNKNLTKTLALLFLTGGNLITQNSVAQDTTTEIVKVIPNYGGLSSTSFYLFITVIGLELVVILFLAFSIRRVYVELLPQKLKSPTTQSKLADWWAGLDKKLFTRAVPVEKEADVLLDHNYDGIQELDNSLPPWWKYGFYITIGIAIIYMFNFHVFGTGKNPVEEYNLEMENARIAKEIFESNNIDKIDEKKIPFADAAGIERGKTFFLADCWGLPWETGRRWRRS